MKHSTLELLVYALVVVGAVNWGLVGVFDYNLVTVVLGAFPVAVKVVYALVGLSGVYMAYMVMKK